MPRISLVAFAPLALLCVLASCGAEEIEVSAESTTTVQTTEVVEETTDSSVSFVSTSVAGDDEPSDSDENAVDEPADETNGEAEEDAPAEDDGSDEIAVLCAAYLDSISFGTVDDGLAELQAILGLDAPPGIQDALEVLQNPNGDIEGFFAAQSSLDDYILPICTEQFSASITPLDDNESAADAFVAAVRDGDRTLAESLAPTNVIVSFDWNGFPDASWDFTQDDNTVSMLLEPTVVVFCRISDGAVASCAFGD